MTTSNPFRLVLKPAWLARSIERVFSLTSLAELYERRPTKTLANPADGVDDFLSFTINGLDNELDIRNPEALADIPSTGPLVFVANHPFGGLEGVAMSKLLRQYRPDLKVLTNEMLTTIPEFSELFIGVDVLSKNAAAKNSAGIRQTMKHVKNGGALLIYPAGQVSAINKSTGAIEDREWNSIVGQLVLKYKAAVMPFFVHGRNSKLFYMAGLIHPRLRTALLPRELANKAGRTPSLTVGQVIEAREMGELGSAEAATKYLRTATDLLSRRQDSAVTNHAHPDLNIDDQLCAENISIDLAALEQYKLLSHKAFDVYCAPYDVLNSIMDCIAVARERTFRAAGEGTGLASDSDRFDKHYEHLFIWDNAANTIVGGYRIGKTDEIVEAHGVDGLYSRSLYEFDANYIKRFEGAAEVGRSFVSPEYQRHPRALDLLWQGIGAWVVNNPKYYKLFGCVSISSEHSARARAFLSESLMANYRAEQEYLNDVRPIAPLKVRGKVWSAEVLASLSNLTLINKLLGQCDPGKSVPILLRHYIALNGRFIGFSVNHGFNESLDGLIIVDLRKTAKKYLQRYLGKDGCEAFIKQWSLNYAAA